MNYPPLMYAMHKIVDQLINSIPSGQFLNGAEFIGYSMEICSILLAQIEGISLK